MKNKEKIPEERKNNLEDDKERQLAEYFSPDEEKLKEMREEASSNLDYAKTELYHLLGINNLSNIEAFRLRKIMEKCVKQKEHEEELIDKGKMDNMQMINVAPEAARRWLWELYGIHNDDIPYTYIVEDDDTGEIFEYPAGMKKLAGEKFEELKQTNHLILRSLRLPKTFVEYINRQREKAHKP